MPARTPTNPETPVARLVAKKGVVTHAQALAAGVALLPLLGGIVAWTIAEAQTPAAKLERRVEANEVAHDQAIQLVREEIKEQRNDVRALHEAWRTDRPSARLMAPVPELRPLPKPVAKDVP